MLGYRLCDPVRDDNGARRDLKDWIGDTVQSEMEANRLLFGKGAL